MSNQPRQPDEFDYQEQDPAGDQDGSYIAPDEPMGVQGFGTTLSEEREGESFAHREKHTSPEAWEKPEVDWRPSGQLLQPGDEDVDSEDTEAMALASDREPDLDVEQSAEEAAMHTFDEP